MGALTILQQIERSLVPGEVYRRSDFKDLTSNVDRNLAELLKRKRLQKIQNGLYVSPKETVFGQAPPDESKLLRKFLNDDHFVVYGLCVFNSLGLGTTQLYDKRIVFNRKRHGEIRLGGRNYFFYRWREAPKKLSREFLLVEMFNRLNELAENNESILKAFRASLETFNRKKLYNALNRFGTKSTQNKIGPLLKDQNSVPA